MRLFQLTRVLSPHLDLHILYGDRMLEMTVSDVFSKDKEFKSLRVTGVNPLTTEHILVRVCDPIDDPEEYTYGLDI